ncbi:MAG: thymidine phosphorylase [Pirellulaceae bacterium]|nr:thymidine phosphorylase [Pirellulaceae bacterium]
MLVKEIIEKKRDGQELSAAEIQFLIQGVTTASIPDYQVSAWLMAVLCRGMSDQETAVLTEAMLNSGNRLARCSNRPRVDKHSTGGLGDKTSLILAPLLACFDLDVPMLSGRGLGITGGTLDKLEAYPGFRCDLTSQQINEQLNRIGCVITGTTSDVAPADRRLYALRDVTGTVPSIPLITGSIMSKKLAGSLDALVLDVKWGSGAFMTTLEDARRLEASLVHTGRRMGVKTSSLVTDMNQPLGQMVGNACEVNEAYDVLCGAGPTDVVELTVLLAAELLVATGTSPSLDAAQSVLTKALKDGRALARFQQLIEAQGGVFSDHLPLAQKHVITSLDKGWLCAVNGRVLGNAVIAMGGGRQQQGDPIDPSVGLQMLVRIGDSIERGQEIGHLFCDAPAAETQPLISQFRSALSLAPHPYPAPSLIVATG